MTVRDFMIKNGIPLNVEARVERILRTQNKVKIKTNFVGNFIIDSSNEIQVLELCSDLLQELEQTELQKREEERLRQEEEAFLKEEEDRIAEIVRTMPITSTASFDGYRIVEYGGYVSGDEAIELSDSYFSQGDFNKDIVNDRIKEIRSVAIDELKTAAAQIGCNAVVGLDFDYVTIDRQRTGLGNSIINRSFIILTANGTAVNIEPL